MSHNTEFTFNRFKVQFITGCPIIQGLPSTDSRCSLLHGISWYRVYIQQIQGTIYYRVSHNTEFTFNRFKAQFITGCPIIQSLPTTDSRYNLLHGISWCRVYIQQIQGTIYYRVSHNTEFTFNRFNVQSITWYLMIQSLYSTDSRYNLLQGVSWYRVYLQQI